MKKLQSHLTFHNAHRFMAGLCLIAMMVLASGNMVHAIGADQRHVFDSGAGYFDLEEAESSGYKPGAATGGPLEGCDNAQKIWNYLTKNQGFTPIQAAGIMANLMAESGFNPKRVYGTSTPDGDRDNIIVGDVAYGIAQWLSEGRQQGLADLAKSKNLPSGDLGVQLEYLMIELTQNPYYKELAYDPIRKATTLADAVNPFLHYYEAPGHYDVQEPLRLGFATDILARFGSGGGCPTGTTNP